MKAKLMLLGAMALLTAAPVFARTNVVQTSAGGVVRGNYGNSYGYRGYGYHGNGYRHGCGYGGSQIAIGFGFGFPGFYGGYPGFGYGYYPYGGYGYPYGGYGYPYGGYYGGGYYPSAGYYGVNSSYGGQPVYGTSYSGGNVVARVQERLARAGYYRGAIDGLIGPRTRYAIRAYESRHGLPADGEIDRRLLATLGLA